MVQNEYMSRSVVVSFVVCILAFPLASVSWGQASYSIRGVNVPAATMKTAYEKAVRETVVGAGAREPVSERAYVAAWEAYQDELERREQEKRAREQAQRYQNRNQYGTNRGTYSRGTVGSSVRSSTTTVKAGAGLVIKDANKPVFIDTTAVVVVPGKQAILYSDAGTYFAMRSSTALVKDGRKLVLNLKKDPDRKTHEWRKPTNEVVTINLYDNVTISPMAFVAELRKGRMLEFLPEVRKEMKSGFKKPGVSKGSSFGGSRFGSSGSLGK